MATKYGFKGKVYLNSGSYGSPTWNEVSNLREVKVGAAFNEDDVTVRAGGGLAQFEAVILALEVSGKIKTDEADTTGFVAMETAFLTRAALDVMVLDADDAVTGARGFRFDAKVFKFEEDQANEKTLFRDFTLKPCLSANAAQKAVVASGSPVFTSLAA